MHFFKLIPFIILVAYHCHAQNHSGSHRIAFYNVENLFDTLDHPEKRDNEFTPSGSKRWNAKRYHRKIHNTYKTIIAIGEWQLPLLVGFAEIENQSVLKSLTEETPLVKYHYEYISEESDDERGIDVGLIFRENIFQYQCHDLVKVPINNPTRDILYVKGKIYHEEYHIYVNHWPSRIGGKEHTSDLRLRAAVALVDHIQGVIQNEKDPRIIIMGDFNDESKDPSLSYLFDQKFSAKTKVVENSCVNEKGSGTVTYTNVISQWFWFDQILLSNHIENSGLNVFKANWLLNKDGKPKRTYLGNYYNGGFSDHLPVYLDLHFK